MTKILQDELGGAREAQRAADYKSRLANAARPDDTQSRVSSSTVVVPSNPNGAATELRKAARAENTRIAYEKAWRRFTRYCHANGIEPGQAGSRDVADFFIRLAVEPSDATGRVPSLGTLKLYRSALNRHYAEIDKESPAATTEVSDVLGGLARLRDGAPRRVKALREYEIKAMIDRCPDGRFGRRDAAVLSLGFAAALRRSELCALLVRDIEILDSHKMVVWIRRSKTDQVGRGQRVAVPEGTTIKPVSHLRTWLDESGIRDGHLFQTFLRGGQPSGRPLNHSEVPRLIKKYAEGIGLDPQKYSGHSLRAGFVTSAAAHRARLDKIMEVTRHKNPATVLQYIRDADAFENHAGEDFL